MKLASWIVLILSARALDCQIASAQLTSNVAQLGQTASTQIGKRCCDCGKGSGEGWPLPPSAKGEPKCVSSRVIKSLVEHIRPLEPPCCGKNVNVAGRVIVEVLVDAEGSVKCARAVKGHPLAITSAIEAVPKWKFKSYLVQGVPVAACGNLIIKFRFRDRSASTEVQ